MRQSLRMPYRIIRPDGTPMADLDGNVIEFATRKEAERWLMPGERVQPVKPAPQLRE